MLKRHFLTASIFLLGGQVFADSHGAEPLVVKVANAEFSVEDYDRASAEKIFQKSCRACHGNKAQGAASYPKLSDKEPQYLAEKLEIYRSGQKIGPNSILMIQHAKKLSDEDIANISFFVATAFD
jgi:cytochrome c553